MDRIPNGGPAEIGKPRLRTNNSTLWLLLILGVVILVLWLSSPSQQSEISYGMFHNELEPEQRRQGRSRAAETSTVSSANRPSIPTGGRKTADGRLHTKFVVVVASYPLAVIKSYDELLRAKVDQDYKAAEPRQHQYADDPLYC